MCRCPHAGRQAHESGGNDARMKLRGAMVSILPNKSGSRGRRFLVPLRDGKPALIRHNGLRSCPEQVRFPCPS